MTQCTVHTDFSSYLYYITLNIYMQACKHTYTSHIHIHAHKCMHTCTHTCTHACTCTCTCTHTHTRMHTHVHTCAHTCTHTHVHTHIHTHMHTYAHTHTCTCTYMHMHMHMHMHIHAHAHAHTCTCACTYICMHTHTHTHTYTYTHTHTHTVHLPHADFLFIHSKEMLKHYVYTQLLKYLYFIRQNYFYLVLANGYLMDTNQIEPANNTNENQHQQNILNNVERDLDNGTRRRNEGTRNNLNPRDRLFYALFMKIGQLYARLVPKRLRILLEIVVLLKVMAGLSFLYIYIYIMIFDLIYCQNLIPNTLIKYINFLKS